VIDRASLFDSGRADVVNGSHTERAAEMIVEQFAHAAKGTSASQQQSDDQPPQPRFSHGEIKLNFLIVVGRCKSILQRLCCPIFLLINKLPADVVFATHLRDGLSGQCRDGECLTLLTIKLTSQTGPVCC